MSGDNWMNQFSWIHELNNGLEVAMQKQYAQMGVISAIENTVGAAMRHVNSTIPAITAIEAMQKEVLANTIIIPKTVLETFEQDNEIYRMYSRLQKELAAIADLQIEMKKYIPDVTNNYLIDIVQKQKWVVDPPTMPLHDSSILESMSLTNQAMEAVRSLVSGIIIEEYWDEDESKSDLINKAQTGVNESSDTYELFLRKVIKFLVILSVINVISVNTEIRDKINWYLTVFSTAFAVYAYYYPRESPEMKQILEQLSQMRRENQELNHELRNKKD